jgi:hypothetical protein
MGLSLHCHTWHAASAQHAALQSVLALAVASPFKSLYIVYGSISFWNVQSSVWATASWETANKGAESAARTLCKFRQSRATRDRLPASQDFCSAISIPAPQIRIFVMGGVPTLPAAVCTVARDASASCARARSFKFRRVWRYLELHVTCESSEVVTRCIRIDLHVCIHIGHRTRVYPVPYRVPVYDGLF